MKKVERPKVGITLSTGLAAPTWDAGRYPKPLPDGEVQCNVSVGSHQDSPQEADGLFFGRIEVRGRSTRETKRKVLAAIAAVRREFLAAYPKEIA